MQDGRKAVWSIPYVFVAFFPGLKHNFIAYRSSNVCSRPECIFEIHQLWKSGFSRVCSNSCCSCSFEPVIIKVSQSSHNMYSNNIVNFQEFNFKCLYKKVWKLIECTTYIYANRERERERKRERERERERDREWKRGVVVQESSLKEMETAPQVQILDEAFQIGLVPLGNVYIQQFSRLQWKSSGADLSLSTFVCQPRKAKENSVFKPS